MLSAVPRSQDDDMLQVTVKALCSLLFPNPMVYQPFGGGSYSVVRASKSQFGHQQMKAARDNVALWPTSEARRGRGWLPRLVSHAMDGGK